MTRSTPRRRASSGRGQPLSSSATTLRIIGGEFRGRKIGYTGDTRTRPMKDRLREAVFNLVGPAVRGKHAVDLFAGTGALALEALSRGARCATMIECHFPTAKVLDENASALGVENRCTVVRGDVFVWGRSFSVTDKTIIPQTASLAWVVFCCPPYAFYRDRWEQLRPLLSQCQRVAPAGSLLIVESDLDFATGTLPLPETWDTRSYSPAQVSIHTVSDSSRSVRG
ncbi:MAG: RsmD family RNA methyltransferase [Planctomycetota bacterium]|nr:RsmD family RNA methyltransferase [Planctomycetota bacterium]